jgi:hypothetical protein
MVGVALSLSKKVQRIVGQSKYTKNAGAINTEVSRQV